MQFIKNSIRELKHVVWPTKEETIQYFKMVFWTLFFFTIFLYILSNIFAYIILFLKDNVWGF